MVPSLALPTGSIPQASCPRIVRRTQASPHPRPVGQDSAVGRASALTRAEGQGRVSGTRHTFRFWIVTTSLKGNEDFFTFPPVWIPPDPSAGLGRLGPQALRGRRLLQALGQRLLVPLVALALLLVRRQYFDVEMKPLINTATGLGAF